MSKRKDDGKGKGKGLNQIAGGIDRPDLSPKVIQELHDAASDVAQHRFNADTNINKGDNFRGPVIAPGTPVSGKPGKKC